MNFYKTAEQVCSVLDSLEREYRREDDWCGGGGSSDKAQTIVQLISKHQEQKEAFLKACTLARRTAETFLKYANRSQQYYKYQSQGNCETHVRTILDKLLTQENQVLEFWTQRKKSLDQCQQFVLFERSAKQAIEWIHNTGEAYLSSRTNLVGKTREETEGLLKEHNEFRGTAKETRERVKLLIQLADSLVEKGHAHASAIKQWVASVDQRCVVLNFAVIFYINLFILFIVTDIRTSAIAWTLIESNWRSHWACQWRCRWSRTQILQ